MNRIDQIFADLRAQNKRALMPFVCGGHPKPDSLRPLIPALEAAGVPVLLLEADMVDPRGWNGPAVHAQMTQWLEERVR